MHDTGGVPAEGVLADLLEGTEVEAFGLRNNLELNGSAGHVVGKQRAPDGAVLVAVRLLRGETRLFNRANLREPLAGPLPNLTGAWGAWFSATHVFHHEGSKLTVVDSSSGKIYQGIVKQEKPDLGPSLKMQVIRADHPQGWIGPTDDEPQPMPLPPTEKKQGEKRVSIMLYVMGTVGKFNPRTKAITWKSGAVWTRTRGKESAKLAVSHPALTQGAIPDSPNGQNFSI